MPEGVLGVVCGPRASANCLLNSNKAKMTASRPCAKIAFACSSLNAAR
ncbi:MAG: hypothetical protein N2B03_06215 [Boseongicola sp.]